MVFGVGVVLEVFKNASCFGTYDSVEVIKSNDLVHASHLQNDFVVDWLCPTYKASIATLRYHSQKATVAVLEHP
jgi:hypothetical protein